MKTTGGHLHLGRGGMRRDESSIPLSIPSATIQQDLHGHLAGPPAHAGQRGAVPRRVRELEALVGIVGVYRGFGAVAIAIHYGAGGHVLYHQLRTGVCHPRRHGGLARLGHHEQQRQRPKAGKEDHCVGGMNKYGVSSPVGGWLV